MWRGDPRPEPILHLDECLPAALRGDGTSVTPLSNSFSGAGVYRIERDGRAFVLKVSDVADPIDAWKRRLQVLRSAAAAGLAPRIVHVDEVRRAVVSAFVGGPPVSARFADPATREAAIAQLGRMLRRVHDLPLPADVEPRDLRAYLISTWDSVAASAVPLPAFVAGAVERVLAAEVPDPGRVPVLSHNDAHPANLVHDGEHLLLVDWDAASANEPYFDLATIAMFLRLDDASCARLIAAHDDAPAAALPARFRYDRRLVAVVLGVGFLAAGHAGGHSDPVGDGTLEAAPTMLEFYTRMRAGTLDLATGEGRWWFGLALVKAGATL